MAVRIKDTTRADLCSVPVPASAASNRGYTAISHKFVMDYALQELQNAGFNIQGESYRCTGDGNIAQGVYHLTYNNDPEIGMMFAWSNSYNKQMRFKCAIGGYVFVCMNGMLTGDMGTWNRKHTGSADEETEETILDQITNAHTYYNQLVSDKDKMKEILLTNKEQAGLLGILFAEYEILTTEQISLVREQMNKPSFAYNADKNSLWSFYNHVTLALKKSHPKTWMEDQRKLHMFVALEFDLYNFDPNAVAEDEVVVEDSLLVDPAQTNLLDQIEEIENDNKVVITGENQEKMIVVDGDDHLSMGPTPDVAEIEVEEEAPSHVIRDYNGTRIHGPSPDVAEIDPTGTTGRTVEPVEQGDECMESNQDNLNNIKVAESASFIQARINKANANEKDPMITRITTNELGGIDVMERNSAPEVAEIDGPGSDHDVDEDIPCRPMPEIDLAEPDFDRAVKIENIDTSFTSDDVTVERGPSPDAAEIDEPGPTVSSRVVILDLSKEGPEVDAAEITDYEPVKLPVEPSDYFDIQKGIKAMSTAELLNAFPPKSEADAAEIDPPLMDLGKVFHTDIIVDTKSMTADEILENYGPQTEVHVLDVAEIEEPAPQPIERDYPLRPEDCNPLLPDADIGEVLPPMAGSVTETGTILESVQEGSSGDDTERRDLSNVGKEPEDLGDNKTIVLDYGDNNPVIGPAPDAADLGTGDLVEIALKDEIVFPKRKIDVAEISNEDLGEILIDEHSKIEDEFDFSLSDDEDAGELDFEL